MTSALRHQFPNSTLMNCNRTNSWAIFELKVTGGSPASTSRGGGPRPPSGEGTRGGGSELRAWGGSPRREERDGVDGEMPGRRRIGGGGRRAVAEMTAKLRPFRGFPASARLEEDEGDSAVLKGGSAGRGRKQGADGERKSPS